MPRPTMKVPFRYTNQNLNEKGNDSVPNQGNCVERDVMATVSTSARDLGEDFSDSVEKQSEKQFFGVKHPPASTDLAVSRRKTKVLFRYINHNLNENGNDSVLNQDNCVERNVGTTVARDLADISEPVENQPEKQIFGVKHPPASTDPAVSRRKMKVPFRFINHNLNEKGYVSVPNQDNCVARDVRATVVTSARDLGDDFSKPAVSQSEKQFLGVKHSPSSTDLAMSRRKTKVPFRYTNHSVNEKSNDSVPNQGNYVEREGMAIVATSARDLRDDFSEPAENESEKQFFDVKHPPASTNTSLTALIEEAKNDSRSALLEALDAAKEVSKAIKKAKLVKVTQQSTDKTVQSEHADKCLQSAMIRQHATFAKATLALTREHIIFASSTELLWQIDKINGK